MEKIATTVLTLMQGLASKQGAGSQEEGVWVLLQKNLTKKELKHINFNYFKKGILGVKVDSSAWLYNFNLKKERLLASLNGNPGTKVKNIRFNIGRLK